MNTALSIILRRRASHVAGLRKLLNHVLAHFNSVNTIDVPPAGHVGLSKAFDVFVYTATILKGHRERGEQNGYTQYYAKRWNLSGGSKAPPLPFQFPKGAGDVR